ncbi:MAG: hypothetical protein CM15mP25_0520 [Gammaproteobacteria bacterium]|nr:MAG: hypothetical protein CM15mP25_0520 [Gammaproteobacteria bacterium]
MVQSCPVRGAGRQRRGRTGALEKAASLEETPSYYHYVYAVAQHDQGRPAEAMATLKAANRAAPGQPNVIAALMQYSQLAGDMQAAQRYQAELRNTAQAAGCNRQALVCGDQLQRHRDGNHPTDGIEAGDLLQRSHTALQSELSGRQQNGLGGRCAHP